MKLKDQPKIRKLAKDLGLGRPRDAVKAIREYCVQKVEKIIQDFGDVTSLNQLLQVVSSALRIKFEEVYSEGDLDGISEKYLSRGELIFADIHKELDDRTDAILIELHKVKPWEPRYIAVIDCRGYKAWKAYFSKWHEVAHVLTLPAQMAFKFRRTPTEKKDPEEQIVDRVAGDLGFYSPIFTPELESEMEGFSGLTFETVERLRATVCCEASREATVRAAVSRCPFPQLLVIADYGLKKNEQRALASGQMGLFPHQGIQFKPQLRAVEVIGNIASSEAGLWIHRNMIVPEESIIATVYESSLLYHSRSQLENLSWWKHSRGRLRSMSIWVEAMKSGDRVLALISRAA